MLLDEYDSLDRSSVLLYHTMHMLIGCGAIYFKSRTLYTDRSNRHWSSLNCTLDCAEVQMQQDLFFFIRVTLQPIYFE